MNDDSIQEQWHAYKKSGDSQLRNEIIEFYLPLVKKAAERMFYNLAAQVDIDDLYSSGLIGLMDAIEKFMPSRHIKFSTFSAQRIRGAMLDDLRDKDWVPRQCRQAAQKYQKAYQKLLQNLQRPPSQEEMITELGVSEKEFSQLCQESNILSMVSMQKLNHNQDQNDREENEWLADPRAQKDDSKSEKREFIVKILESLPEKKKAAIIMYFIEEMTLKEIAQVLEVTEGRISQIISTTLKQLKSQYQESKEDYLT